MTRNREHAPGYVPNPHYSQEDRDEVSDKPERAAEDFAQARPRKEAMPDLHAALTKRRRGQRGPGRKPAKALAPLRIDRDVVDAFKGGGES
jgi:uncharacterized protein (DUF4415 family)